MPRHKNDFYETHAGLTGFMLNYMHPLIGHDDRIFECCVGDGAIVDALNKEGYYNIFTNDIDPKRKADYHRDATSFLAWQEIMLQEGRANYPQWVITNAPFSDTLGIVKNAVRWAFSGVICLARLSFLEPCNTKRSSWRGGWLDENKPDGLFVVGDPRPSFRLGSNGKPQTDNVTVAWYVWCNDAELKRKVPRLEFIMGWSGS